MSIWTICQGLACLVVHELIPLSTQDGFVLAGLVLAVLKGSRFVVESSCHAGGQTAKDCAYLNVVLWDCSRIFHIFARFKIIGGHSHERSESKGNDESIRI